MKLFSLPKNERLTHDGLINKLFKEGTSVSSNPIRIIYRTVEPLPGPRVRIMVTVPRKKFKKAVVRNRIKRLMREAYRHHKQVLPDSSTFNLYIAFIYVGDKEDVTFDEIEKAMTGGQSKLLKQLRIDNH